MLIVVFTLGIIKFVVTANIMSLGLNDHFKQYYCMQINIT